MARAIRNAIRANRFARIIRSWNPYFYSASGRFAQITRISDSRESPDSRESCELIRANHATKLGWDNFRRFWEGNWQIPQNPLSVTLCLEKANRTERTQQLAQRGNPKQNHHAHPMIWPSAAPSHIVVMFFLACDSQRRERGTNWNCYCNWPFEPMCVIGWSFWLRCAGGGWSGCRGSTFVVRRVLLVSYLQWLT